jgi:CubicO group peptidase (beta-lactamase class C family)
MQGIPSALSRRGFIALGVGAATGACAAPIKAAPRYSALQGVIDRYVGEGKIAGAAIAIQRGAGPRVDLAAGNIALGSATPAGPDTLWRIYSMSKPITGMATMALIEAGKLRLDQPIADFFPAYASVKVLEGASERPAREILRVRHLLTHSGGLSYHINGQTGLPLRYVQAGLTPSLRTPPPAGAMAQPTSLAEMAERLAMLPLNADPGARYEYSISLDLLGAVIERAAGQSFDSYVKARLFDPLGMNDTGFTASRSAAARMSTFYAVTKDGLVPADSGPNSVLFTDPPYPSGGGGLVSSAGDYSKFCTFLRQEGRYNGQRLLKPETVRMARSNLLPAGVSGPQGAHFGAGMGVASPDSAVTGEYPVGAFGWGGAAATTMWVDPGLDFQVVFMTQIYPANSYPIWRDIRRAAYADIANA